MLAFKLSYLLHKFAVYRDGSVDEFGFNVATVIVAVVIKMFSSLTFYSFIKFLLLNLKVTQETATRERNPIFSGFKKANGKRVAQVCWSACLCELTVQQSAQLLLPFTKTAELQY